MAVVTSSYGVLFLTGIWFAPLPSDALPGDRFQTVLAPGLCCLHVLTIPTAAALGIVSVVWGVVALLVRIVQR